MSKHPKPGGSKPHPDPNQNGGGQNKREVTGSINVRGEVEAKIPPSFIEHYSATQEADKRRENKRFIVEYLTMLCVIVYAGLTLWLALTAQHQLNATNIDQRAWMGPKDFAILNPPLEANKPIQLGFNYSNFGKTPALKVSGFAQPSLVVSTAKLDFSKWGEPLETERSTLFPGASDHILRQIPALPEPVFAEFMQGKSFVYIYGNLGYDDIFGFHHWTHFCLRYFIPSNGFVYCETFNDTDGEKR